MTVRQDLNWLREIKAQTTEVTIKIGDKIIKVGPEAIPSEAAEDNITPKEIKASLKKISEQNLFSQIEDIESGFPTK